MDSGAALVVIIGGVAIVLAVVVLWFSGRSGR
jgi:hypothetical protein